ncbi:MAG: DUF58 domain-containing protein [Spirochaetales bacterium]|nr:DUF58 domain-containing protein [Spirochaetales bacterium]
MRPGRSHLGGTLFFFSCSLLLILSYRSYSPALMALAGLLLLIPLSLWIVGPLLALVNLNRLKKDRTIFGREENHTLPSLRKILYTAALKKEGPFGGLPFPLFDISYRVELTWLRREGRGYWRRWERTIPLDGKGPFTIEVDREGLERGDYRGRDGFLITDWFGFFRCSLVSSRPLRVKVTGEEEHRSPRFTPSPQAEGVSSFVSLPSEEELVENRPYFPGDDPRKINWKQYARFHDLFIRTAHDPLPHNKWVLCLLSGEGFSLEGTDRGAELYRGLCRYLEERGCEVYTLTAGQEEIGLKNYGGIPSFAPGDRLIFPVPSPGHMIMVGRRGSYESALWRKQAREQGVPFTLFDPLNLSGEAQR